MIWNKATFFDERSAWDRVRGPSIAPWYREKTDDELRERLKWIQECLQCEDHQAARTDRGVIRDNNGGPIPWEIEKCKCGAMRHTCERHWQDMPSDAREKFEEEEFVLTRYFEELGGVFQI